MRGDLGAGLRLGRREWRSSRRQLGLYMSAIAIGVAALVAIDSFRANVVDGLREQGRVLLGADVELASSAPFSTEIEQLLDSLAAAGRPVARVIGFPTMVTAVSSGSTRLFGVQAVAGGWPFYGQVRTEPAGAWAGLGEEPGAVADPGVLLQLGVERGDTIRIGEASFPIAGSVAELPGDVGLRAAVGPRVYIPAGHVARTRLLAPGSIVEHRAYIGLPGSDEAQRFVRRYRRVLQSNRVRWDTAAERERDLTEGFASMGRFLALVGLAALLLGAVGVGSAVHVFTRERMASAAILRCLGATARTVHTVYLSQAAALAALGAAAGVALGVGIQASLPRLLRDLLPIEVPFSLEWTALAGGFGIGFWAATIFAWIPLLAIRDVSPVRALRRATLGGGARQRVRGRRLAWSGLVAGVLTLCILEAPTPALGLGFAAAIAIVLASLAGAARGFAALTRRSLPRRTSLPVRHGLANLYRPRNQTVAVAVSLGFGVFLIGVIVGVQSNLQARLSVAAAPDQANFAIFDIQTDQLETVGRLIASAGHASLERIPIVPGRIVAVHGIDASTLLSGPPRRRGRAGSGAAEGDSGSAAADSFPGGRPSRDSLARLARADRWPQRWALSREYRNTTRDTLTRSERLVSGDWWAGEPASMARVSLETEAAHGLRVGLGDVITWEILGGRLETRVTSLRAVDWARLEPNFVAVFEPGALDGVPKTWVVLTRIGTEEGRAALQNDLVAAVSNAAVLDLSRIQDLIAEIIDRITLVIRFVAGFSIAGGLLILVASVAATRARRSREAVLLRTLGARSAQLRASIAAEYLMLGALAGIAGAGLSALAGWALVRFVFELDFGLPAGELVVLAVVTTLLTAAVGIWGARDAIRRPPLAVLRDQAVTG